MLDSEKFSMQIYCKTDFVQFAALQNAFYQCMVMTITTVCLYIALHHYKFLSSVDLHCKEVHKHTLHIRHFTRLLCAHQTIRFFSMCFSLSLC